MSSTTLEFSAKRRSNRRFRDRRDKGRFFICELCRVVAEGAHRKQEFVCELARFDNDRASDLEARAKFWREVSAALAPYLGEMGVNNHARVIGQLSSWVTPLSDDDVAALVERDRAREHALSQLPRLKLADATGDQLTDVSEYRRRLEGYLRPTKKKD